MLVGRQRKTENMKDQSEGVCGPPRKKVVGRSWAELESAFFWRVSVPNTDKENTEQFKLMCIY